MLRPPFFSLRATIGAVFATSCILMTPAALAGIPEAQTFLQQGQHAQALEQVERVLSSNGKDRQARFLKGVILAEMNKLDEAANVFIKLSEEAPELPEPYNNLAVIYAQQKQYDKAKVALEMAIRTHPSYAVAHENLGDLYAKLARQAYDRALQIDAANPTAQTKLNLIRDIISVSSRPGASKAPEKNVIVQTGSTVTASSTAKPPASAAQSSAATTPVKPTASVSAPAAVTTKPATAASAPAATASTAKPAKPEPVAEPKDETKAIRSAVLAWASAWSGKEIKNYLGAYAKDFDVPEGKSRSAWEKERTDRVGKPGSIKVSLSDIDINVVGEKATVRFKQNYSSSSFSSSSGKTLIMVQRNGRWQIQQERIGR
ncbi:MAG: tetratricopeptide repeat protein [Uliginosibacterium sp.]|nr:tetratricopeptide repeat protein [Uliginosibacterium sp.]